MTKLIAVYITCQDKEEAEKIGRAIPIIHVSKKYHDWLVGELRDH